MRETKNHRGEVWAGAGVLAVLLLGYMLIWWNRGIQLNSNGMPTLAAEAILSGKVPYLDFHFWCPPGHLLIYTALDAFFGDGLIYVRAFAVVERLTICLLVYFWLTRIVSASAAFFGTFAAGVGFSSDIGDVIAHYGVDAVLASVAAGFAASIAMTSPQRYARMMYFVTGLCAGACMVAKQTQGVGVFLTFLVIFAIGDVSRGLTFRARTVLEYLAGWAVPTGLVAVWLLRAGAWSEFVKQNFLQGTSSKGSMGAILLRPIYTLSFEHMLAAAFVAAVLLVCAYGWLLWKDNRKPVEAEVVATGTPWLLWSVCLAALAIGFAWAWWVPHAGDVKYLDRALTGYSAVCIFVSMYANAGLGLRYTVDAIRGRLDEDGLQKWILASVSAVTAYMFSLSWAAFEQMLLPGFAFLLAMVLDRELRRKGWGLRGYSISALGLVLISTATFRKLTWPYVWENWVDGPVKEMTVDAGFAEMRGMRVTPASADFLKKVTNIIDTHSRPDETILCYPNYALFYVLAHRQPGTFAYMHWFDIVSDDLAREEAARVKEHPPALILFVDFPEGFTRSKEISFRGGRRSGQRDLAAAIQSVPGYRVIETVPIPYMDYGLKIYGRQ